MDGINVASNLGQWMDQEASHCMCMGKKSMEADPEMTRVIELVDKDIKMAIINLLQMIKKVG